MNESIRKFVAHSRKVSFVPVYISLCLCRAGSLCLPLVFLLICQFMRTWIYISLSVWTSQPLDTEIYSHKLYIYRNIFTQTIQNKLVKTIYITSVCLLRRGTQVTGKISPFPSGPSSLRLDPLEWASRLFIVQLSPTQRSPSYQPAYLPLPSRSPIHSRLICRLGSFL